MTNHFAYLVDDHASEFFMDAMVDSVQSNHTSAHEKVASDFEKIAAKVNHDLEFLKTAGECGWGLGMVKRADAYIDLVAENCDMTAEEFGAFFDKVATEAILTDLEAARDHSYAEYGEEFQPLVDVYIAKLGHELSSIAAMEKEAFIGAILRGIGRGARGLARGGAMFRAGASAGLRGAGRVIARPFVGGARRLSAGAKSWRAAGRAEKAIAGQRMAREMSREQRTLRRAMAENPKGSMRYESAKAGLNRMKAQAKKMYGPGGAYNLRGKVPLRAMSTAELKAVGRRNAALRNLAKASPAGSVEARAAERALAASKREAKGLAAARKSQRTVRSAETTAAKTPAASSQAPSAGKTPLEKKTTKPAATPSETTAATNEAKTIQVEQERRSAQQSAAEAANAPSKTRGGKKNKGKNKNKGEGGAEPTAAPEVTASEAFKSLNEKGWKGLTPAERAALIRAGAVGAAGYRMVTGHGAITGGEGLI